MHEQREMHSTGDVTCQTGSDDINISNGLSIGDTPDLFCVSNDDPKDVVDVMRYYNWPE